eukprot:4453318-Alexandrium_andersonii.AAC.1
MWQQARCRQQETQTCEAPPSGTAAGQAVLFYEPYVHDLGVEHLQATALGHCARCCPAASQPCCKEWFSGDSPQAAQVPSHWSSRCAPWTTACKRVIAAPLGRERPLGIDQEDAYGKLCPCPSCFAIMWRTVAALRKAAFIHLGSDQPSGIGGSSCSWPTRPSTKGGELDWIVALGGPTMLEQGLRAPTHRAGAVLSA